jgi:hypothetical protein
VDAVPAPFGLARQCVGIDKHFWVPWLHHTTFLANATMHAKVYRLLLVSNDKKALLALSKRDLYKVNKIS